MDESREEAAPDRGGTLPHARDRVAAWVESWRRSGRIVLLLDFDGTLAPIVDRPESAAMPAATRAAIEALRALSGVDVAVVSGRGLADVRQRAALDGIAYAGNHGMEIEGAGLRQIHEEAAAARPELEAVMRRLEPGLREVPGSFVEDKGLTLTVHHRLTPRSRVDEVHERVRRAVGGVEALRVTGGKEVLEIRPRVDWHKGRAVEFLLEKLDPPPGTPVIYLGDDTTDEDAFRALRAWRGGGGEGVVVADPPPAETAALSRLRDPGEVGGLLAELAERARG